jgi:TolB-like protein/DNA-binding winged helix-turn-helix (wHTH) protein/Tfp pilus assembly protein PilF
VAGRFRVGKWTVLPELNSLERDGRTVHLEPKVMQVLVALAEHPGKLVSKEQIFHRVWRGTFVSDEVLTRSVSELRKAFEDNPQDSKYIQTIPKGGYRLVAAVVPEGIDRANWLAGHGRKLAGAAVILLLVVAASLYILKGRRQASFRTAITSLAVLPLTNLSGDPEQEYFADGMTEELITDLAKIGALRVISRTSVMNYKGARKLLPSIARELNVDAVVVGSVQKSAGRVRIAVQLIEARTDRHLWADTYERDLRDVLAMENEVARVIAEEIRLKLTPKEHARLANAHQLDPEAHEAYLRGLYFWNRLTEKDVRKSIPYFERAIQLVPDYAAAYASLAFSYNLLASSEYVAPQDAYPKAKKLAQKALELDGDLADGHAALGFVLCYSDWDWPAAEAQFRQANELEPNGEGGHSVYALYLGNMGRSEEAIAEAKKGLEVDPLSVLSQSNLGWIYWTAGDSEKAITQFQKILEIAPDSPDAHQGLGIVYASENRLAEAVAELQKAVTASEDYAWIIADLGYVYAAAGKREEAYKVLKDLTRISKRKYVSAYLVATVYAGLGEKELAFRWLTKALEERSDLLVSLKTDPHFSSLRPDPRFQALLQRVGLP